ncbi:MAG: hypothetical protein U1C73_00450 [Dietzia sp.]|nr:hypothetical protein [Dietzia sp.]
MGTTRTERVVRPVVVTLAAPSDIDHEADFFVPLAESSRSRAAAQI